MEKKTIIIMVVKCKKACLGGGAGREREERTSEDAEEDLEVGLLVGEAEVRLDPVPFAPCLPCGGGG